MTLWRSEAQTMVEGVTEAGFSRARLKAFSDGVIAVIITIMVLELKAPESPQVSELLKLAPSFAIYFVSFVFVAIYWINHHDLISQARRVSAAVIWANNALLLCLSLIPFATAYVAITHLAPFPTMVYGALQFSCGSAFALTFSTIARQRRDEPEFALAAQARQRKNWAGLAAYALAVVIAAYSPTSALLLFVAVAVAYVVPSLFADASPRGRRQ
jgi:uncharacterized membrane protein